MGNTELRRFETELTHLEYFVSSDGIVYRKLFNKPREWQLNVNNCRIVFLEGMWLRRLKEDFSWGVRKGRPKGYGRVEIAHKSYMVHRLVALLFVPNLYNKPQVNHINGDKWDNRFCNLEWVTNQENTIHAHRVLRRKPSGGRKLGIGNSKTVEIMDKIQHLLETTTMLQKEIAAELGIALAQVKYVSSKRKVQRLSGYSFGRSNGVGGSAPEAQDTRNSDDIV